jgi:hypothetical protein
MTTDGLPNLYLMLIWRRKAFEPDTMQKFVTS